MAVPQELKLIGKEVYPGNRTMRLIFRATGPDHMGLIISPRSGVSFEGWSISNARPVKGPKWQGRDTFFVYYASALDLNPWTFHLDLKVSVNWFDCDVTIFDFPAGGFQETCC